MLGRFLPLLTTRPALRRVGGRRFTAELIVLHVHDPLLLAAATVVSAGRPKTMRAPSSNTSWKPDNGG
jgi:hypothetical protein